MLLALLSAGCGSSGPSPQATAAEPVSGEQLSEPSSSAPNNLLPELDTWDAIYLQGAKIGFTHNRRRNRRDDQQWLVEVESESQLSLERFGQTSTQRVRVKSVETPAGRLRRFTSVLQTGAVPVEVSGELSNGQLTIDTTSAGTTTRRVLAMGDDVGGFDAVTRSLRERPMKPGDTRRLKALMPLLLVVAEVELKAQDYEATELIGGLTRRLLRIKSTTTLPDGNKLGEIHWTDERGRLLKSRVEPLGMVSIRTTKEVAQSDSDALTLDLGLAALVSLTDPLPNPRKLSRVTYRVTLKSGNPAKVFDHSAYQRVKSRGSQTADVTVFARRPADDDEIADDPPKPGDRLPNELIQSDHPDVVDLARRVVVDSDDETELARAIARFVHHTVSAKNFSRAFSSAAEVAAAREGDCTEHAVLVAALARARDLPARVAIGLVYVEGTQAFAYHMWNEIYADGEWLPVDATFPNGRSDAAHLKVADSSLQDASAYVCFLPVAQLLGQLEIAVVDYE